MLKHTAIAHTAKQACRNRFKDRNKVEPLPRQTSVNNTRPNNTTRFLKQAAYHQYIVSQPIVLKLNQKPQKLKGF
ncbi:hypothetical protein QL285_025573 [Trifolium repens]|nr:hypothetical protein QL285_025571 [Trifolium repens]KAK2426954.1 hypothetical protein QL285_025573 [Trifolium repens]